jgi:GntR family transcriptional regulator
MSKATHGTADKVKRRRKSGNAGPTSSEDALRQRVNLTRRSGTSLKHQIFLVIRDQIASGNFPSGALLPSEKSLSEEYRVSRITVRAALAELEASGFIDRRHGVGTFVTDHAKASHIHVTLSDLIAHISDVGRTTKVELREAAFVKAPLHVQTLFKCEPDALFQRAVRIRSRNGLPIFHVMTMVPESIARRFTRKELSGASLYQLLRTKGFQFKAGTQTISAVLALPSVAQMLNLEVGAPLLQVRRLHFDEFMRPFEYMEYLASPAHFEVQMTLGEQDLPK